MTKYSCKTLSKKPFQQKKKLLKKTANEKILHCLSGDKNPKIRETVALNPYTSFSDLKKLFKDKNKSVHKAVRENPISVIYPEDLL